MTSKTFRLFKVLPNFLLGIATVFDMGNTINIYNTDSSPEEADFKALASDWEETGKDLSKGLMEFREKYGY